VGTIRQKIAYNITFSSAARIVDTFLALVITALLTRYLGKAGFGDYIIVFTFLNILTVLADFGIYSITIRNISQADEKESEIISNAFTLRMASTAAVFLIGIAAVFFLPYSLDIKKGIVVASLGFWSLFSAQVLMGLFQKKLRIDRAALAEMAGRIVQLGLVIFFIKENFGFLSILVALSISGAANFAINVWFARKFTALRLAYNFDVWKKMIIDGWPLAVSAILVMFYFRFNIIILSLLKGEEAVGVFGVGYKILENLIFFPAMFVGLVMPMMSKAAKTSVAELKEIMQKAFNAIMILLVPLVLITVILSDKIVYTIAGKNFEESFGVLNILIFAVAFIFFGTLWSNAIIALNKQKKLMQIYFFGAAISLASNYILIPSYSYLGAAWSTFITEFLVTILMAIYLWKEINYLPRLNRLFKIILAAAVSAEAVFLAKKTIILGSNTAELACLLIAGGVFYISTLYFLKGINAQEVGLFFKKNDN